MNGIICDAESLLNCSFSYTLINRIGLLVILDFTSVLF